MHKIFLPLQKIDEERRLVVGRAIQESVDRTNEIIDYATAKPAFEAWSKQFEEMTGGLSKGNVRLMHSPKHVAGKVVDISFNDDEKAIDVVAKIVDDDAWRKCCEGVLTGFSVGGGYGKKWKDPDSGATRYTPVVQEISLVDLPCIKEARIVDLMKADGSIEHIRLTGRARTFEEVLAERPRSFEEVLAGGDPTSTFSGPRTFEEVMLAKKAPRVLRAAAVPFKRAWRAVGRFGERTGAIAGMASAPRDADLASIVVRGARGAQVGRKAAQAATAGAGLGVAGYAGVAGANRIRQSRQLSEAEQRQREAAARASAEKRRAKTASVMREFKEGRLRSSSGQPVTDRKQALAIALSEARRAERA